jgi:hypothetical protein
MDELEQHAADEIRREASAFSVQKPDHRHQSVDQPNQLSGSGIAVKLNEDSVSVTQPCFFFSKPK